MTQINSNGHTWLFVPVPENTSKEEVYDTLNDGQYIDYFVGVNDDYVDRQKIPAGDWSLHCHSTTVTEQQAAEIVTNEGTAKFPCYTNYTNPFSGHTSAIPSLIGLAEVNNIQSPFVILKQNGRQQSSNPVQNNSTGARNKTTRRGTKK